MFQRRAHAAVGSALRFMASSQGSMLTLLSRRLLLRPVLRPRRLGCGPSAMGKCAAACGRSERRTASSFLPPSRIQHLICSTSERPELAAAVRAACRRPSHRVAVFGRVARMRSSPAPSLRPGTDTLLPLITWEGTSDLESYLRGQETRIHAESVSSDSTSWLGSTNITDSQARLRVMGTSWSRSARPRPRCAGRPRIRT
jgi:hypothetical protein